MSDPRVSRLSAAGDAARLLLAAAREREAVAAADLALPLHLRLSDQQRIGASALIARMVAAIEDSLRADLAERFASDDALHASLSSIHVAIALPLLEGSDARQDSALVGVLLRRIEEQRLHASARNNSDTLIATLVADEDPAIAEAAMAVMIAQSRRFDRFQDPALGQTELPAEQQHRLVWLVAATLRRYLIEQHGIAPGSADEAIIESAGRFLAGYDEGEGLEARCLRLAQMLGQAGRLDGSLLVRAVREGELSLFLAGIAALNALDAASVWDIFSDPAGRGLVLLLRAAAIGRDDAAAILLGLAPADGAHAAAQVDLFETLDEGDARATLRLWQADPAYRAAIARVTAAP